MNTFFYTPHYDVQYGECVLAMLVQCNFFLLFCTQNVYITIILTFIQP